MGYEKSSGSGASVVGAVLVAATVGAVLGMLFAPKRGSETREDIKNKYKNVKHKTQDKAVEARDRLSRGLDAARTKAEDTAEKVKDATDKAAEDVSLAAHIAAAESTRRRRET